MSERQSLRKFATILSIPSLIAVVFLPFTGSLRGGAFALGIIVAWTVTIWIGYWLAVLFLPDEGK